MTMLAPSPGFDAPSVSATAIWSGRVLSGLVVLFLLFDGAIKLVPLEIVTQTSLQLGIPTHLARTLGVLTLAGAILYAIPSTAVLGAILLTGYFGGAIYVHVRADSPLFSHTLFGVYLGVIMWAGLWLRDPAIRALIPLRR
ncbi:DoxX family protein [Bradyrhizobium sp. LHD-71]|uniref:DoxX family protein n=1 Tax=Bradyrhizobium sp. LHD-71 TaxID=3072141 RepID=UPI00280CCAF2|nr:DoxX family protein [Bradyrhizobium sp. LHD-71]MDQ8730598.1 DoxX family protein [Bradyrhizobium sp. LHD-71]